MCIAGGIGSGKTAAAAYLTAKGWEVVDADSVARDVVQRGASAWTALVDAFGRAVLDPDGEIDRGFLAEIVFHDASALRRLNAITHPAIGREIVARLDRAQGALVFLALPLFEPEHRELFGLDEVWALEVSPATALARLCQGRGLSDEDARSRLTAQMSNEARRSIVDRVIENEGSLEDLHAQLDVALAELAVRRD